MNKKTYFLLCLLFFMKWTYSQSNLKIRFISPNLTLDGQDLQTLFDIRSSWKNKPKINKNDNFKRDPITSSSRKLISSISAETLRRRIDKLNEKSQIKTLKYNTIVHGAVENYLRMGNNLSKLLALAEFYFPLFEKTLNKHGIPEELKYLAIVESHLDAKATSKMGAKGLWQFMPQTAKLYNLHRTSTYDDSIDPLRATEAACIFLKSLYGKLGDWNLVLAAYNSGTRTIQKAIRRSNNKNFWSIRNYLPKETRNYIPKFIAINYILNYYNDHNIKADYLKTDYDQTAIVEIKEKVLLSFLANELDIPLEELRFLNPQFISGIVPIERGNIRIPIGKSHLFLKNEASIYAKSRRFAHNFPTHHLVYKRSNKPSKKELKIVSTEENFFQKVYSQKKKASSKLELVKS